MCFKDPGRKLALRISVRAWGSGPPPSISATMDLGRDLKPAQQVRSTPNGWDPRASAKHNTHVVLQLVINVPRTWFVILTTNPQAAKSATLYSETLCLCPKPS